MTDSAFCLTWAECQGEAHRGSEKECVELHSQEPGKQPIARGFTGGSVVISCNAGDVALIPGLGRSPGEELVTNSSILAWEIQWTENLGGLQSMGVTKSCT